MRRILLLTMVGLLMATSVSARRPKDKAGSVKDGVFVDKKYGFSLEMSEDWKYKTGKNKSNFRLTLTQINYEVPPNYMDAESYTKIPRTVVYADTTGMGVTAFIDSLLSDSYKSKQKKEIFKEFEIINDQSAGGGMTREKLVPRQRKAIDLAGERGLFWTGKVKYRNEIATSASSMGGRRVYGGYGGCIIGVKKGDLIVLMHTICEENYFESVVAEAMRLANTLKFAE